MDQDINDTPTMHSLFEAWAEKNPHHIAIISGGKLLSYEELNQKANQLAHYLKTLGVQHGSLIAISMQRSPELLIGILGILKASCAYLPLDEEHPSERLLYILADTQSPLLITSTAATEKFSAYRGQKIILDSARRELSAYPVFNPTPSCSSNHLAYVIYTSGSTGKPKGVLIEHKSVVNYTRWFSEYSDCRPQHRVDFSSNIIFDMAVTTSITALALGLQVVICSDETKLNTQQFLKHLHTNKINLIKLTPSYFKQLVQEASDHFIGLCDLQSIILGGENLLTKDCAHWLTLYPEHHLFNEYGPTETTVAVTQYKISSNNIHHLGTVVPIGIAGPNMVCLLLNEHHQPSLPGEVGELHISGLCLARGYLNQAELTAARFITINSSGQLWYKTGDLCRQWPDGYIEFIERVDDQVKIRGYRIELGEVESTLESHPLIKDTVVLADKNHDCEKQLIAYCIPKNKDIIPSKYDLRHYLRQRLADFMIPSIFVIVEAFPLTANGKLDKNTLSLAARSSKEPLIHASSHLEQKIMDMWCEVFHTSNLSVQANFFELGGHSLTAARIMIKIEQLFQKKINLEDLYRSPTIKELATTIESAASVPNDNEDTSTSLNPVKTIPLSDFQFLFWLSGFFEPKARKLNIISRRRIAGTLDITALQFACESIFKTFEILSYRVSTFLPAQYLKNDMTFTIVEKDLSLYSDAQRESLLSTSLDELLHHYPWSKQEPLMVARLFYLESEVSELQISVPHIAFDDASEELLFSALSRAYLLYKQAPRSCAAPQALQYKDYIHYERRHLNHQIDNDINFWTNYLRDANLVKLPAANIIHDMDKDHTPYSTYIELPKHILRSIQYICAHFHISITDILCAAIGFALKKQAGSMNNDKLLINIIRSTRDNDAFENMIGCFIRLDPIKVDMNSDLDLVGLSRDIQRSRLVTEIHQACSSMVKYACLENCHRPQFITTYVVKFIAKMYASLFKKMALNPRVLEMYGRLKPLKNKQYFMINVNIFNNFFDLSCQKNLFGHTTIKTKTHQYDLSTTPNVLDICLLRNEGMDKYYLVVSANLDEPFRHQLGHDILNLICTTAPAAMQKPVDVVDAIFGEPNQ